VSEFCESPHVDLTVKHEGAQIDPERIMEEPRPQVYVASYDRNLQLQQIEEDLPAVVRIPFEDVVANSTLQGWEDEWVADGEFDVQKWGKLEEPKIDFIYTCTPLISKDIVGELT
jgi:hypothetical protein